MSTTRKLQKNSTQVMMDRQQAVHSDVPNPTSTEALCDKLVSKYYTSIYRSKDPAFWSPARLDIAVNLAFLLASADRLKTEVLVHNRGEVTMDAGNGQLSIHTALKAHLDVTTKINVLSKTLGLSDSEVNNTSTVTTSVGANGSVGSSKSQQASGANEVAAALGLKAEDLGDLIPDNSSKH